MPCTLFHSWLDVTDKLLRSTVIMILLSMFNQIKSLCRSLACNVSASHVASPSYVFSLFSAWHLACLISSFISFQTLIYKTKLSRWSKNLLYFALFFLSFSSFPLLCHLPRLFRFHPSLFHPPPYALLWETQMQWGGWGGGFFLGTFFSSQYIPKACSAAGRSKGIMTELCCEDSCGGRKAHVNGQQAVGQQSLLESQKSWSQITLHEKLWNLNSYRELSRLHEHCFTSQQSASPSAEKFKNQIVYHKLICARSKNDLCRTRHMAGKCNFSEPEWLLL